MKAVGGCERTPLGGEWADCEGGGWKIVERGHHLPLALPFPFLYCGHRIYNTAKDLDCSPLFMNNGSPFATTFKLPSQAPPFAVVSRVTAHLRTLCLEPPHCWASLRDPHETTATIELPPGPTRSVASIEGGRVVGFKDCFNHPTSSSLFLQSLVVDLSVHWSP